MIDSMFRFISLVVLKIFALFTQLGGYGIILAVLIYAAAEIDSKAVADLFANRWVKTVMAEDHTITKQTAELVAHVRLQDVSFRIVAVLAFCVCIFRISPKKDKDSAMKKTAMFMAVMLALVGIIGNAHTIMQDNKGASIFIIFTNGYNFLIFIFGSVVAAIPTILIEVVAMAVSEDYEEVFAEIKQDFYKDLVAKVKEQLSNKDVQRKRTSFLSMTQNTRTGTNP